MIKLKAFNHAAFRVSDVEKATAFYENVVGLKRIPRPNFGFGGAWYGIGNNALHIISSENRGQKPDPLGAHVRLRRRGLRPRPSARSRKWAFEFLRSAGEHGRGPSTVDPRSRWQTRSNCAPKSKTSIRAHR